jgi:uncharacterized SAM-binding protein YcdF (DUF218 family)
MARKHREAAAPSRSGHEIAPARGPILLLLGAPLHADGSPGPALHRRLACALRRLRRDPNARVLATGGVPPRALCRRTEAAAAAAVLASAGIAADRILVEPRARNTWENAERSALLLRRAGLTGAPLLLVTDPWHVPRARLAFRAQGLSVRGAGCRVAGAEGPPAWPRLLREAVGFGLYLLRWLRVILRSRYGKRRVSRRP